MPYNSQKFKIWRSIERFSKTEYFFYLILLLIFLFQVINNFIVVNLDNTPLTFDAYQYYANAKSLFYNLKVYDFHPPMLSFLVLPFFALFGVSQKVAMLGIGTFSLFVLFLTTYLLAKELHSKEAGLLSVFILSGCPIVFGQSRTTMSDLVFTGWLVFSLLLMVQSRGFILLRFIIPLGIVMGLGMLTRIAFPLYVAGPLIYLLKKANLSKKICFNLLLIFLIIFSLCSFWYLPNFYEAASRYAEAGGFSLIGIDSLSEALKMIFSYIIGLLGWGMGVVILPLFFIMLYKRNKKGLEWLPLLLTWIIIPYLVLSILDARNMRFVLPLLPAAVIGYSFLVLNIEKTLIKKIVIFIIVFFSISQTLAISYSPLSKVTYPLSRSFNEWVYHQFGLLRPWKEDWKIKEIANVIRSTYPRIKKDIVFIKMRPVVSSGLADIMYEETRQGSLSMSDQFSYDKNTLLSKLKKAHIVLFGEAPYYGKADEALELFMQNISMFELINVVALSDGSQIRIYKGLGSTS